MDYFEYNGESKEIDYYSKSKTDKQRDYYVVKHNDLIQNQTFAVKKKNVRSLSVIEQKLFLFLISKIKPEDMDIKPIRFSSKQFCKVCGIGEKGNNYQNIKNAIENLMSRVISIESKENIIMINLISETNINKGSGDIVIILHDKLKPYVLNLYNNYTQYPLKHILAFKYKYSFILYELLKSYQFNKTKNTLIFTVEELKKKMDCMNYDNFNNLFKRVLEPSVNEINRYTELEVYVNLIKEGRAYKYIEFKVSSLDMLLHKDREYFKRMSRIDKELEPEQLTLFERMYHEDLED